MKHLFKTISIIGLMSVSQLAYSGDITDDYADGDTLTAPMLNNIKSAVNDNDSRITGNTSGVANNTAAINTNAASIATNNSATTANTSNIGINTANIGANSSAITALQSGGDGGELSGLGCSGEGDTAVLSGGIWTCQSAGTSAGQVGIGTIIAHTVNLAGADSIVEMQSRGFALCNGTTPQQQGIVAAMITGVIPDLNGGTGLFLRGGTTSGAIQQDATAVNGLSNNVVDPEHSHIGRVSDFANNFNPGSLPITDSGPRAYWDDDSDTFFASGRYRSTSSATGIQVPMTSTDSETRPANMSVVWMMRVR